jgi:MFS transporter, DHA1 family, inner membrane transport protein
VNERLVLFTLAAVQFTHIMDFMILMPLGSHLMRVFDISPGQFSRLVAAYSAAAAVTGFIGGFLLDRFDRKHALLFLYAGFGLATLGCALANTYEVLLIARLAAGAFGGLAGSVVTAAVGDVIPAERRGTAMGVVMTAFPIASVLGVPVGLILADAFEWHAPFYFLAASSLVIGVLAQRLLPLLPPHPVSTPPVQQMKEILFHPVHRRGFVLSGVLVFGGGLIIPFMAPSMVANVGLSESQLPLVYLAGGIFTFFTMPWVGRLSDRHDKLQVFAWISAPACVSVLVLTNLPPVHVAVALAVTTAFMIFMSGRFPPAMTMVTNSVDARYRGGFMSVNSAVQQAAGAIANTVGGWFITREASGYLRGYSTNGILTVIAFATAIFLAARLRAIAPQASRSRTLVPAVGAE